MKTILVAVDFSEVTPRLVDTAVTLARGLGSKLHLVHVAAPEPDFVGYEAGPPGVRNIRAKELRKEHRELETITC